MKTLTRKEFFKKSIFGTISLYIGGKLLSETKDAEREIKAKKLHKALVNYSKGDVSCSGVAVMIPDWNGKF